MDYTNKDKQYIDRLARQFGHAEEIAEMYKADKSQLQVQDILADLTYRSVRQMCLRKYRRNQNTELKGRKARLFHELTEQFCPDYAEGLMDTSIIVMLGRVDMEELEKSVEAAKSYLARNPGRKVNEPKGERPVYTDFRRTRNQNWTAKHFAAAMNRHIEGNTGIRLPAGLPALFYEKFRQGAGL